MEFQPIFVLCLYGQLYFLAKYEYFRFNLESSIINSKHLNGSSYQTKIIAMNFDRPRR